LPDILAAGALIIANHGNNDLIVPGGSRARPRDHLRAGADRKSDASFVLAFRDVPTITRGTVSGGRN